MKLVTFYWVSRCCSGQILSATVRFKEQEENYIIEFVFPFKTSYFLINSNMF